ncbi:MAG: transporter, family, glucarate transporter [Bryobacterales bacterium]|nr:transporter, family, glucarate transporter [Bryobacterales bacterium]
MLRGRRFYIVLFLFFNVIINFIDRVNLSIAAPAIAKHFSWDSATMGWVFSAYLWTYTLCLIPSGWLVDRFGTRLLSSVSIGLWSACAMLTGAVTNFTNMVAVRFGLGIGESAAMPACNKVIRQWFPVEERGFATAIFHSGVFVSVVIANPLVAWLVIHSGWRWSFVIVGALGFVWLYFWLRWFQPPEQCSWLPESERRQILKHRDYPVSTARTSFWTVAGVLLRQKTMWGLALTEGCVNYMNYLFLSWLPSYLIHDRGMNLMQAGLYGTIPYVAGVAFELFSGRVSDRILTPERLKKGGRRNQVVLFLILSSVIVFINYAHSQWAILAVISIALSFNTTTVTFMYSLTNDLVEDPQMAGAAFGVLLVGGNLFGMAAPVVTGYLVKSTGNFTSAFGLSGLIALAGAAMAFWLTRKPITGIAPQKENNESP